MSKERIWYPLSETFIIKTNLINYLADIKKQYKTFLKAKDNPYSVDDALISKMYKSVVQQSKNIKLNVMSKFKSGLLKQQKQVIKRK